MKWVLPICLHTASEIQWPMQKQPSISRRRDATTFGSAQKTGWHAGRHRANLGNLNYTSKVKKMIWVKSCDFVKMKCISGKSRYVCDCKTTQLSFWAFEMACLGMACGTKTLRSHEDVEHSKHIKNHLSGTWWRAAFDWWKLCCGDNGDVKRKPKTMNSGTWWRAGLDW